MSVTIRQIEVFQVRWEEPLPGSTELSAWVRLHDDSGHVGLGEVTPMLGGDIALAIIHRHLREILIGADPMDSAVLHDRIFHHLVKVGPDGAAAAAIAGVDIALWDLKGKILGLPVYKLLGGAWRDKVPFYTSVGHNAKLAPEVVAQRVTERLAAEGTRMAKVRISGDRTARDVDIPGDIAKARAVREAVGPDVALAFDANNGYSIAGAIKVGRALEELDYVWFEEPVQHYHEAAMGEVARRLDIAVAAGEQTYTVSGFADLIAAGVRVLQPDIVKMGGITGMQRVIALAHAHGVDVAQHQTQPTIGQTACLHVAACQMHQWAPLEFNDYSRRQHCVFSTPPDWHDGHFWLGNKPGLGLETDEEAIASRRVAIV
jgi:D-arabinonate dehydratase/D-galactarolactone cycloisomerase